MSFPIHPIQVIVALLAEWVRREQEKVIEFLESETKILREQLGDRRILLSDNERRLLAVKGMTLSKGVTPEAATTVSTESKTGLVHAVAGIRQRSRPGREASTEASHCTGWSGPGMLVLSVAELMR